MAMGSFNPGASQGPTAEINMTPLVDVMLVLLIIFIITAPLMTHAVKVDLPQASSQANPEKPATLSVTIDAANQTFVAGQAVARADLEAQFKAALARDARLEMRLQADRATRYESVAETMSAARRAGLSKIAFVTQPARSAAP